MSYIVRSSRIIEASAEDAFDTLADHDSWSRWMPASFRPVGKSGRLVEGAKFHVRILGMPMRASCKVTVVKRPMEITWCGGAKGVLWAEHRFLFESKGVEIVEVQSVESWHGFLARLLRFAIAKGAQKVGEAQLEALASATQSRD
jgi:uncharacterized protein YndB with AHSA1/START domain